MSPKRISKWNKYGQVVSINAEDAGVPHFRATWFEGTIGMTGVFAPRLGECELAAARRVYGHKIPACYTDSLVVNPEPLTDEYPTRRAR